MQDISGKYASSWMILRYNERLEVEAVENPSAALFFGLRPERFEGISVDKISDRVGNDNRKQFLKNVEKIKTVARLKRPLLWGYRCVSQGGRVASILCRLEPLPGGGVLQSLAEASPEELRELYLFCGQILKKELPDDPCPGEKGREWAASESGEKPNNAVSYLPGEKIRSAEWGSVLNSLSQAMDAVSLTAWEYDLNARRSRILYGHDLSATNRIDSLHPNDREAFLRHFYAVARGEKSKDTILTRIHHPGDKCYRFYESTLSRAPDLPGENPLLIGSLKDVTDVISVQTELTRQKDYFALALEAGELSVWVYDIQARKFSSLEGDTLAGEGLSMKENFRMMHPDDISSFKTSIREIINGRVSQLKLRLRYRHTPEAEYRYYHTSIIPVQDESGRIVRLVGTQKDITEEFQYQRQLSLSKQKTDLSIRVSNLVLWEFDCNTQLFTSYNEPLNDFDESVKLSMEDYLRVTHPDDVAQIREKVSMMMDGLDQSFNFDIRYQMASSGEWQHFAISGSPFEKNSKGEVIRYVGVRKDDTVQYKKTQFLNTILNSIPVPIYLKNKEYQITFANEEFKSLFGEIAEQPPESYQEKSLLEKFREIDRRVFETGEPYYAREDIRLLNHRVYDTIVRKSLVCDGPDKFLVCARWDESQNNELRRKSKVLSISMVAMDAYTWYYNENEGTYTYGEGFDKTGCNGADLDTQEKLLARIHPEDLPRYERLLQEIGERPSGDFRIDHRIDLTGDGRYEWWECRGRYEMVTVNGVPQKYMYGLNFNIEKHKQSEQALLNHRQELARLNRQNELVLNNTNSGLVYITTDYVVQWENVSVCSASLSSEAYKKGEICYQSTHGRNSPCEDCVMLRALVSRQMEQTTFGFENGKTLEVFATPVLRDDGEVDGVVIRLDDITERVKMIHDIEEARKQAEQSDRLKSAFLANMSHEIRTPLNAIVGFSDLMMVSEDSREKEEYSRYIKTNNDILLKLINDILDLSKIEAGAIELKYERFDLATYFQEVAVSLQCRITNPAIVLNIHNPYEHCVVELDKSRLTQVLTNYVTNAIKYTSEGFIEMGYAYGDRGIRFYVRDSGIGIDNEKKDKVFYRFEKLDEFAQGTGLGLSICKAIVEAFGGSVGFESTKDVGSEFWAWIPCHADITENRKNTNCSLDNSKDSIDIKNMDTSNNPDVMSPKKRILVAEDIMSNYLLINAILKNEYELKHAVNGAEALDMLTREKFDLVLMDMKMPVMGGLEATEKIRQIDSVIPIIALTAHAFESDKVQALNVGCNDYLVKPVDKALLMKTIHSYLNPPVGK